jgi:preprotein translocase subunit YajC
MAEWAYAMGGAPGGAGSESGYMQILMFLAIFVIFYFLLIRPQQKKQKELKNMLSNLKHGDTVITTGGLYGKVAGLTEAVVTLEIADKVKVKVSRGHIAAVAQKTEE